MKIPKTLTNLLLVFSLLFCLGFACGDDTSQIETERGETGSDSTKDSGLPVGSYACFTTVPIYAGQGAGGHPIYNFSRQTRGGINIKSNGTYSLDNDSSCRYSYNPATKNIQWLDCTFAQASSSQLTNDNQGNPLIQVKFSNDKEVWDCAKQ